MDFYEFKELSFSNQIKYLKSKIFEELELENRVEFLEKILVENNVSSKLLASTIKMLREIGYSNKKLLQKYLYHVDNSVSNAARKAINYIENREDSNIIRIDKIIKNASKSDKLSYIDSVLNSNTKNKFDILLLMLRDNDIVIRKKIVNIFKDANFVNEDELVKMLSKSVWYVRSSIVEILGSRKSLKLLEKIDLLLNDTNVEVKLRLIDALKNYDREKVFNCIKILSEDKLIWVKREAKKVLQEF